MRPSHKKPGTPEDWLCHAKSDFDLARLAKEHKEILPEQVCFHAQQACEKALKALLLFKGLEFPLVHDIETLLTIAQNAGLDLPNEVLKADFLTPYAVDLRYPGFEEEVSATDVKEAIEIAKRVIAWASGIIKGRD